MLEAILSSRFLLEHILFPSVLGEHLLVKLGQLLIHQATADYLYLSAFLKLWDFKDVFHMCVLRN